MVHNVEIPPAVGKRYFMKSNTEYLSKLCSKKGWGWWRTRRSAKNGSKSGYKIRTNDGIVFVKVNDVPSFCKEQQAT